MSDTAPAAPIAWKVVSTQQATVVDPSGKPQVGQDVTYQLESGQGGTVFIQQSAFNPANVKAMVAASAANLAEVLGLTHES